jgi:hypothetical protein
VTSIGCGRWRRSFGLQLLNFCRKLLSAKVFLA